MSGRPDSRSHLRRHDGEAPEFTWPQFRAEVGRSPMSRLPMEADACGVESTTMQQENTNGVSARRVPLLFVLLLMLIPGSQLLIYPILWVLMPSE